MPETKSGKRMAGVLLLAFLFLVLRSAGAAPPPNELQPGFWQFEQAEITKSEPRKRPAPDAAWREVRLPDAWSETLPGYFGQAWYRMTIHLPEVKREPYAIYVPNRRSYGLVFYVNGVLVGSDVQRAAAGVWYSPQLHTVPPSMLRPGANLIEVGMYGDAKFWAGLGRLHFGLQDPARFAFRWQNNWENTYQTGQMVALFVLGLFALALWAARPTDKLLFWFMAACLSWSVMYAFRQATLGILAGPWNQTTAFMATTFTPLFTLIACLRAGDRKLPLFESAVWISFFAPVLGMHLDPGVNRPWVWEILPNVYTALVFGAAVWLLAAHRRRMGWSLYVFVASVIFSLVFPIHDVLRDAGILDLDRASIRHYQTIDLVLGIGAIVLERYLAATKATESMNVELERRVAEKTLQIEEVSRRMQAIREERALAIERERILADMHDGVGASLVALTHVAEDESVGRTELAQRARDALQDLRMAIDSLESYEGDLATVLGNMRQRLGQSVAAAGLQLEWAVEDLPVMQALTPSVVLDVQRIVYEAVTNAVRHARARRIRVAAARGGDGRVRVSVEDDGAGFDAASVSAGHGLKNLRRRAERLGAGLDIRSTAAGTTVILDLPTGEAAAPAREDASAPLGFVPVFGVQQA